MVITIIAWIIASAAWAVILLGPPAAVLVVAVPRWRRRVFRPLYRRAAARRERDRAARRAVIEARTAELMAELDAIDAGLDPEVNSAGARRGTVAPGRTYPASGRASRRSIPI